MKILLLSFLLLFLPRSQAKLVKSLFPSVTPTKIVATVTPSITASISGAPVKVDRVVDGDTIKVIIDNKIETVRLIGVDTPEVVDPRKPVQCFGKEASEFTKKLLENQSVILVSDPTQGNLDKYGRLLRYVYLPDGTLVNQKIIANGYGHEYTYRIPYKFQTQFKDSQKQAESNNLGLWSPTACQK
ncbi:thermonuclease family protein [Candidatus Shapirobacteria bacterium]|nr:thermonuclease family protein [Candidatus Shapirobacteria bacterium]